jgi:CMP-N-acetylneuraminic acid synthetase
MRAVAIIPARGGSKRLPRKNIVDFLGRPIIAFTIDAAVASGCFERVVVSTEDDEIAEVCSRLGAVVDRRSERLATDTVTLVEVCDEFLDREEAAGRKWDVLACLYATAPLRTAEDIRGTVALIEPGRCGFAMAVTTYDHYPHQALKFAADSGLTPMWPDLVERRTTELPRLRAGNGSTYVVDVTEFRRHRSFYGPNLRGFDMPASRSIDIDTQDDLDLARCFAQLGNRAGESCAVRP